jgi:hypothetical protein
MDSLLAEAYTAQGHVSALVSRNRQGDSLFRRALALDSTVATTWGWYALLANHMGDDAEAMRRVRRAQALEPASLIARVWEGQIQLNARRYALADSLASDVLGRIADARALATRLKTYAGGSYPPTGMMACALDVMGNRAEPRGKAILDRTLRW